MYHRVYGYRWAIVGAFWLVIFAFGANWFAVAPTFAFFEGRFGIQSWQSHLLMSLIGVFVIFFAWPAGSLVDQKGPKSSISIGAFFMMVGFGLRPFLLDSFPKLLLSSVIAGIGLAWILVALAPQMLRWFPQKSASLPVGIASSGLFIGFGTGSLFMSFFVPTSIQTTAGMFNGFLIFGILAIVAFLVWIAVGKDHPHVSPEERMKVEKMKLGEGLKHTLNSRNAYAYPIIGFFISGITLVTSAFLNQLYPGNEGGYISGLLLYGCAIGAFVAPFIAKRIGLKKVAQSTIVGAICLWLMMFAFNSYGIGSLLIISVAFLFGVCLQTSWPLALYSQETEEGVSEANAGIAASLYISISNIGAAVLPVLFPLLFKTNLSYFVAILVGLILCTALWGIVKRK